MKAIFGFFFKLFLLVLLALLCWGTTLVLEWPLWAGLVMFVAVIATFLMFKLLRRLWISTRARVKLSQSELVARKGAGAGVALFDLTDKWKQAIELLRQSRLKRFGNPLYVLPWYMVVGEAGSGKTTAITRSRLASVVKNISQTEPIKQTADFEWWFFSKSIVIDTAGRYVSPDSLDSDQAEWEKILGLLAKYRPKDGLDGLVIVIDADRLLSNDSDLLDRRGRTLRERVDQLIRLFDKRFPIYVLVTKCDLIPGFNHWCDTLPESELEQAMGYVGKVRQGNGAEGDFVDIALGQVTERLKQLRLDMAVKGVELSSDALTFPLEIERLRPGLHGFLSASFGNTPYLEQPLLRGIFFSSGRHTGTAVPGMLRDLLRPTASRAPRETGVFLHDFFGNVLPRDRGLFLATQIVHRWRQVTRNLALVTWLTVVVVAVGFVLMSYASTKHTLTQIERAFPKDLGDGSQDVTQARQRLAAMRQVVDLVLEQQTNWQSRWLAFSPEVNALERDLKQAYVAAIKAFFARQSAYGDRFNKLLADQNSPLYADAILATTRHYNKSQASLRGASYEQLLNMPGAPPDVLRALDSVLTPEVRAGYDRMVSAYFAWSGSDAGLVVGGAKVELDTLSKAVFGPGQMPWLLSWADTRGDIPAVTLNEFWLPGSLGSSGVQIRPAFTRAGELRIQEFLEELSLAFKASPEFVAKRKSFESWYQAERVNVWHTFASEFEAGEKLLVGESTWREMVRRVNRTNSPHYMLIGRLRSEFEAVPQAQLPGWLVFARDFSTFRRDAQSSGPLAQATTVMGVFNAIGGRAIQDSLQTRSIAPVPNQMSRALGTIDAYRKFINDFDTSAAEAIEGDGKSYQMAADYFSFGVDPNTKTSSLRALQETFAEFRKRSGFDAPDDAVLWPLVGGPLQLLIRYVNEQASCGVQRDWEKTVLWRTQTAVSAKEVGEQLFGQQGSVWAFANSSAKPFIQQKGGQFLPVKALAYDKLGGVEFPFHSDFLPFLNRSIGARVDQLVKDQRAENAKGKSVKLAITSRPIGVNTSAKVKPYAAILSIQCANEEIVLNNFNVQANDTVTWSPDLCGDVSLQIKIESLSLTRRYPGALGLARFIEEFQDGERIFTPEDFPAMREKLEGQDVRSINVRYDFVGQEALLKLASDYSHLVEVSMPTVTAGASARRQLNIPERVGQCWLGGRSVSAQMDLSRLIEQRVASLADATVPTASSTVTALSPAAAAPVEDQPEVTSSPPVSAQRAKTLTHVVVLGDTLSKLAIKYQVDVKTLMKTNRLTSDLIKLGETLKIPAQ
jgi:type VI secretion system protein ImpL